MLFSDRVVGCENFRRNGLRNVIIDKQQEQRWQAYSTGVKPGNTAYRDPVGRPC